MTTDADPTTRRPPASIRWCRTLAGAALLLSVAGMAAALLGLLGRARDPEISGTVEDGDQRYTVIDDRVGAAQAVLADIDGLLVAVLAVAVSVLLFAVFHRAITTHPFDRRNVRDLRVLALVVAVGGSAIEPLSDIAVRIASSGSAVPSPAVSIPSPLSVAVLVGLGTWALAVMFAYGADLADDVAATI